jgi:hypothetical protein
MRKAAGLGVAGTAGACVLLALVALPSRVQSTPGRSDSQAATSVRPQAPADCGRVRAEGQALVCADGTVFRWNGVTAFALLDHVADGRRTEADAFMRWARATGFNLVRVLAVAHHLFKLEPADGRRHLDALFSMAAARGLYVEIVAIADSGPLMMSPSRLREQVEAVGRASAAHPNAIVEIANEHYHPTQSPALHDPEFLRELARGIPPGVLYTESAASDDAARDPQGQFITRHLSRAGTGTQMLDRLSLLVKLGAETGKPVVSGEPIGAGERDQPGRRLANPGFFRDLARRTAAAGLAGGTFHCEDGIFARIPGPVQQLCAKAWVEGAAVRAPGAPRRP